MIFPAVVRRLLLGAAAAFAWSLFVLPAGAQDYPAKPIRFIVPYAPGGTGDLLARLFAERMQRVFATPVLVENRAGANGNIGTELVARAAPDGYTILFTPAEPLVINKTLYAPPKFDVDAMQPVAMIAVTPLVLIMHPKLAIETVPQLLAYARSNPDRLNYGSQGRGSTAHITAAMFAAVADVRLVHIPYQGGGPAMAALLAGQVDMMFVVLSSALPHLRSGKLRVLAVGSERRHPAVPDTPAVEEFCPGFSSANWFGMAAPAGTPMAAVNRLSAVAAEVLKEPEIASRLADLSLAPVGSTPAEMARYLKLDSERWARAIRANGIAAE